MGRLRRENTQQVEEATHPETTRDKLQPGSNLAWSPRLVDRQKAHPTAIRTL